ncbi:hypothetical protein [Methylomonas albis]|uniref:Uncharacterized protein n=1 Tax=Methylomonas albis TaxID=1854563 RepID=A0ABR9D7F9_9GAMM|nr:hypothetical protein [Methylomonas albis]MBD9357847.1 hypothetical protein [Methylomonas albis]CAD6881174.1 hypothetical protein [Methylomonas albis]
MNEEQRKLLLEAYVRMEVYSANSKTIEWPSLFSNLIQPRIKDLSAATEFYASLNDKQIEIRLAIHHWEAGAWGVYEALMGCSLDPISHSIDPRIWAKKELNNVDLLLDEGINQLMTPRNAFSASEIPELYCKLITGAWEDFIMPSLEESKQHQEARAKYFKENGCEDEFEFFDAKYDIRLSFMAPHEKEFLNKNYLISRDIQALLWYKEFLVEVVREGITFYDDIDYTESQISKKRNPVRVKELQRSNDGFEAIRLSFDRFISECNRTPKWAELMSFMVENQPRGIIVEGVYERSKLIAIVIEGVDKPIDRAAFKKRFDRYFKKTDIKQDIS